MGVWGGWGGWKKESRGSEKTGDSYCILKVSFYAWDIRGIENVGGGNG